jgi:hypothetical protein
MNSYSEAKRIIQTKQGLTEEMPFRKEVRQICSLRPTLINLVIGSFLKNRRE